MILYLIIQKKIFSYKINYNLTPAPFKKTALSSNCHLGFAGESNLLNFFNLNFSKPTIAIIAALSPHKCCGGKIGTKFSSTLIFSNFSLILLLAATPPAITKTLFFF